jgi:hypothetical protein
MSDLPPPRPLDVDDRSTRPDPLTLRYRTVYGAPPPRRIRLDVPGWAGPSTAHGEGAPAQPWHCQPFADGATYGLELIYPYPAECIVCNEGGTLSFRGPLGALMEEAGIPHPFGVFAAGHYGMATALDLLPPPGYALRLEPHPRFFTDRTGEVPIAVPGHLRRFWPRQFFAVFRAPEPGTSHVFRPGEPYAQLLVVPETESYEVIPMEPELDQDRARQDRQVTLYAFLLAKRLWRSDTGHLFDDKYKQLLRIYRQGGCDAVREHLQAVEDRATPPGGS